MIVLLVGLGAVVGAPTRYLTDRAVQRRFGSARPWGTFVVNAVACFVLGLVVGIAPSGRWVALVGTGFCGALSTWSTFALETVQLGRSRPAVANVVGSVVAGVGLAALGWLLGAAS
ncbi:MAG: fluoride efflux transporter FluC [Jatrophihabitans sp.]|uniref:fluoride efflux transporter FluC n=1 Tax=Jatrophihabitans sp. TaxID=1932789 RepID=UPI003F7F502E